MSEILWYQIKLNQTHLDDNVSHSGVILRMEESRVLVQTKFIVEVHVGSVPAAFIVSFHPKVLCLTLRI